MMKAYLIPYPVESFSKPIPLSMDQTTIGRIPDNEIVVPQQTVSRQHAKIIYKNGQFQLMDLKSQNGTRLNGKPIKKAALKHHDKITIGNRTFQFILGPVQSIDGPPFAGTTRTIVISEDVVDFSEVLAQEASHAAQGLFQPTDTKGHDDWLTSRKSNAFLSILYQLSEKLRTLKNIDEIIEIGLAMIFEAVFSAERSMIMIKSATKGSLEVKALKYRETEPTARENVPVSHTLLNWVLNEKMVLVSQDVAGDARFNASESMKDKNVQSIICAPMIREEKVIGVVYLDSSRLFNLLTQEDAAFVAAAANELALSIENIRLQKEALRNERMAAIGMTVSNLSHNIRNLITLNQNAFDLMGRHIDKSKDAKLKKNWKWIQQGFSGIHRLAVEMLEYAKEPEVRLELADINQLILDWQASLEEGLKLDGVELELQLAPHIPNWMMDEAQCQRALLNLVMNAAHAVKDRTHPLIQLGTQINPYGDLVISVADNGCGIPRDRLNRVVELFFTTKGTQGSGLGLPMVQKFMDQMEGELKVESKENEGSIFKMIFPKL